MNKGDSEIAENAVAVQFFEAARLNDTEKVVAFIKEEKIQVDARDPQDENRTALHAAAKNGNEELIRTLVEEFRANINIEDMFGEVPLHIAADNNHVDIVKFLVEKGSSYSEDVQHLLAETTAESNLSEKQAN